MDEDVAGIGEGDGTAGPVASARSPRRARAAGAGSGHVCLDLPGQAAPVLDPEVAQERARSALATLHGTPALTAAVELLEAAARSAGSSRSTRHPVREAPAGTPDEALAMVALLAETRTSLGAIEDVWMLEAAGRIRAVNAAQGKAGRRLDDGVTANIALARRASTSTTSTAISAARRVARSMPALRHAKRTARLPESTVLAVASELSGESEEICAAVDERISRDPARLDGLGDKRVQELVADIVLEHSDPVQVRERCERAARRRYLQVVPQRHGMARVTAVITAFRAAQIEAVVQAAAESARAAGTTAAIGALRADALVEAVNYYCDALTGDPPREVAPVQEVLLDEAELAAIDPDTGRIARRPDHPGEDRSEETAGEAVDDPEPGGAATATAARAAQATDAAGSLYPPGPLGSSRGPDLTGAAPPTGARTAPPGRSGLPRLQRPAASPKGPRIELLITITDRALLHLEDGLEYAALSGYGLVPSRALTRELAGEPYGRSDALADGQEDADARAEAHRTRMFYRRLYTHPASGELVAMDATSRIFPVNLRRMVLCRDRTCRMPWCNATARQIDHIHSHASGGPTAFRNGQGLCAGGNYDKDTGDWDVRVQGDPARPGGTIVVWTSPYGATGSSPTPAAQRAGLRNRAERRAVHRQERLAARAKDRAIIGRRSGTRRGAGAPTRARAVRGR